MAQQSLYRRYRPRRFAELRGQEHVVGALRNAVASGSAGQGYLFSGPRGTGKTSTARILAKALNCTDLHDGEPCGACESCRSMDAGTSYDLFELDAASNNGVDAMRDLVARAAVGSPGRTKVYILDEVHMLSAAASNALLKTLEEPPDHVTFVLATTDPQKVLPTIRSRTQHFEFTLLTASQLEEYVRWVVADAGLAVTDEAIAHVVRVGRGSARDTLSALDQVVAAGGIVERSGSTDELLDAIGARNTGAVLTAVAGAVEAGRDPRVVGEALLAALRDAFLSTVGAPGSHLAQAEVVRAAEIGRAIGAAGLTRALEAVGAALIEMRQAADPRIPLEVALVRLTDSRTDTSVAALAERIDELEIKLARGVVGAVPPQVTAAAPSSAPASAPAAATSIEEAGEATAPVTASDAVVGAAAARARLAELTPQQAGSRSPAPPSGPRPAPAAPPGRGSAPAPPTSRAAAPTPVPEEGPPAASTAAPAPVTPAPDAAAAQPRSTTSVAAPTGEAPTIEQLAAAMSDGVLSRLKGVAKAIYTGGRFVSVDDGTAVFALANAPTRDRAERVRSEVEAALAAQFGRAVPLRLVEEGSDAGSARSTGPSTVAATAATDATRGPAAPVATSVPNGDPPAEEYTIDPRELTDATDVVTSGVEKLAKAFPGAVVIDEES